MHQQKKKNFIQRKIFNKYEKRRVSLKAVTYSMKIYQFTRWHVQNKFLTLPIKSSLIRINNMCCLTGRASSVYQMFKLSRLQLRKLASKGFLPGVYKNSW